jgi:hypothetical protein
MKAVTILSEILKATIRIEKKLDEVLVALKKASPAMVLTPFHFKGQACPLCGKKVEYQPVIRTEGVGHEMIRLCGCVPQATQLPMEEQKERTI